MPLLTTLIEKHNQAFNAIPPGVECQQVVHYGWYCHTHLMQNPDIGTLTLLFRLEDNEFYAHEQGHYLSGSLEVAFIAKGADRPEVTAIPVDAEEDAMELIKEAVDDFGLDPALADKCAVMSLINYAENLYRKTNQQALYSLSTIPF